MERGRIEKTFIYDGFKVTYYDGVTERFHKNLLYDNYKGDTCSTVRLADGKTYRVTAVAAKAFKAKKIRTVTIGANVSKINRYAFKSSKAAKLIVKTKKLTKSGVKGSLKGSKIKKIQVKVGKKSQNKKYVKKYKKIFTKKNAGKKVTVK